MRYQIKADPEIFEKFKFIGKQIADLGCIVQNDDEISSLDLADWCAIVAKREEELRALLNEVVRHVVSGGDRGQSPS